MQLYSEHKNYKLYEGNMLDMLEYITPNSIDSVITDPPYELNFMAKSWDSSGIAFQKSTWEKCFTVLKPGGYLLAFGGTRTFHRIACAIEDAGFEIRDTIMYLYGSGFPKSMNIGKSVEGKLTIGSGNVKDIKKLDGETYTVSSGFSRIDKETEYKDIEYERTKTDVIYHTEEGQKWSGWGTALKPAYEPIIIARKPCEGTCVDNVIKYGVGGINIDECRVGDETISYYPTDLTQAHSNNFGTGAYMPKDTTKEPISHVGRYPSNVILTYDDTDQEEVIGGMPYTISTEGSGEASQGFSGNIYGQYNHDKPISHLGGLGDSGSAARYFYCAKASNRDRDEGLEDTDTPKNIHPTVKPCDLMQYLVRLVTPKGGTVLDPFNGSGSTGKAVMYENHDRDSKYKYIGIELTHEYLPISDARIKFVANKPKTFKLF